MATVARIVNGAIVLVEDPAAELYWRLQRSGAWAWNLQVEEWARKGLIGSMRNKRGKESTQVSR